MAFFYRPSPFRPLWEWLPASPAAIISLLRLRSTGLRALSTDASACTDLQTGTVQKPRAAQPGHGIVSSLTETISGAFGLGDNAFAAGGLQLLIFGGLLAGVRLFASEVARLAKERLMVTARFESHDESYSWVMYWLANHPYANKTTNFSVATRISSSHQTGLNQDAAVRTVSDTEHGLEPLQPVYYLPAPGLHFLFYRRRLVWFNRELARPAAIAGFTTQQAEWITISTIGRSREFIQGLVREAQLAYTRKDRCRTIVFAADQYGVWRRTRSRPRRPMDTIVLEPRIKDMLIADCKDFLASETWYSDRGIPYRRGYLFYGSPGTGKSSTVYALAGELGMNIYVINLSNKSFSDDSFAEAVCDTPVRSILLIEDVDAAFVQRTAGEGTSAGVTFSGLLNAIDGVSAQEGRLLMMTTNHVEKLDPALIRPGRIDMRVCFGLATKGQARELFLKFYPCDAFPNDHHSRVGEDGGEKSETCHLADRFAAGAPEHKFSVAALQGFLMRYRLDPAGAVAALPQWLAHQKERQQASVESLNGETNVDV